MKKKGVACVIITIRLCVCVCVCVIWCSTRASYLVLLFARDYVVKRSYVTFVTPKRTSLAGKRPLMHE